MVLSLPIFSEFVKMLKDDSWARNSDIIKKILSILKKINSFVDFKLLVNNIFHRD